MKILAIHFFFVDNLCTTNNKKNNYEVYYKVNNYKYMFQDKNITASKASFLDLVIITKKNQI